MRPNRQLERIVFGIVGRSPLPEDRRHAQNVLAWVLRIHPGAGEALRVAAVGHDVERAFPERKVQRADFASYDAFKRAHARNSARILDEVLVEAGADPELRRRAVELVALHECGGGDPELTVLTDADSLSFFETNLPYYHAREGPEETLRRMRWGLMRLSPRGRQYLSRVAQDHPLFRQFLAGLDPASWASRRPPDRQKPASE